MARLFTHAESEIGQKKEAGNGLLSIVNLFCVRKSTISLYRSFLFSKERVTHAGMRSLACVSIVCRGVLGDRAF